MASNGLCAVVMPKLEGYGVRMIDFYFWPTPNGQKIAILLEELNLQYVVHPVDITKEEQFKPEFLAISPNNKMPAIVDLQPVHGGGSQSVFESGAIMHYLAEKTGRYGGGDPRTRIAVTEWLFWQVGGLGPMAGQAGHFNKYAKEKVPYAIERYTNELKRLAGVLDKRLSKTHYIAGTEYTIADMASYPWVVQIPANHIGMAEYPHLKRWVDQVALRPAVMKAMALKP